MNIVEDLRSKGIMPSVQRIEIYRYLNMHKNHPTADQIYKELHPTLPTLSKTTVYNTLQLFVGKKLALEIHIEGNEVRYDANTLVHGHFKCHRCGEIHDFELDNFSMENFIPRGFTGDQFHFYIEGLCDNCSSEKEV